MKNSKKTNKIGKVFRELKGIYKPQPYDSSANQMSSFKMFRENFLRKGMKINNINYSIFSLKNGLAYYGLKATMYLEKNSELIKIPLSLLITCKKAYDSELKTFFDENPDYFLDTASIEWQKRILMAYLIYQQQIGIKSKWYQYINILPKVIETFSFWSECDQQLVNDDYLIGQAEKDRQKFLSEFRRFKQITLQYQQLFNPNFITLENCQRIYIILQTRIFGNTLPELTLIPFCDLFNHECVNVYYELDYKKQTDTIQRAIEHRNQQYQKEYQYNQDQYSDSSSDGSYDSIEVLEEEKFDMDEFKNFLFKKEYDSRYIQLQETFLEKYEKAQSLTDNTVSYFEICDTQDYQLCPMGNSWNVIEEIHKMVSQLNEYIFTSKLEETIALLIAGQFNYVIDEYIAQYMLKIIPSTELSSNILQMINEFTTQKSLLEDLQNNFKHQILDQSQHIPRENFKIVTDEESQIQYFVMSTSHKDSFQTNSQVYFCYGRLSNRQLLLRYGFCLEYNKYDHVYINLNYLDYANCRHTIYLAHMRQVKKTKLVTLRQTRFPTELVQFCKALSYQYKIHNTPSIFMFDQFSQEHYAILIAINIIRDHIETHLNFDEIELANQLSNPKLNYNEYFSIIYRLEQQRICTQNINLLRMALMMIEDLRVSKKFDINSKKYDQSIPQYFILPYKSMIARFFKQCNYQF